MPLVACTDTPAYTPNGQNLSTCGADRLSALIGQPVEMVEAVSARPGTLRIIRPGDAITEDYSETRLNAELDANDRIIRLWCG
jgi:hypothetical protein